MRSRGRRVVFVNLPAIQNASDHPLDDEWARRLARGARGGSLVRIRQGCYVNASEWNALDKPQQYRLTLHAVLHTSNTPPLLA